LIVVACPFTFPFLFSFFFLVWSRPVIFQELVFWFCVLFFLDLYAFLDRLLAQRKE